jgi:hypothetical protein
MAETRRIVDDRLYCHFITFSVFRRRRLLDHAQAKRIVLGVLNFVLEKHSARWYDARRLVGVPIQWID